MAGPLQTDAALQRFALHHWIPLFERHRGYQLLEKLQIAFHLGWLGRDAEFVGIFQHQGQQARRRLTANDRATKAGCKQGGDAADMVEVNVGDHQRPDAIDGKSERGGFAPGIAALLQAAVDQ